MTVTNHHPIALRMLVLHDGVPVSKDEKRVSVVLRHPEWSIAAARSTHPLPLLSPPCPLPSSAPLLHPAPLYPSTRNRPRDHTCARLSTAMMMLRSLMSRTQALSAMSMRSNAGDRTAKMPQNCQRRTERGRGRRPNVCGMCLMLPATSMPGYCSQFWGDHHRYRPIPSGVRVGRRSRPRLAHNRVLSRPISPI